jgi:peptide/nickel transport system permease protein
VYRYIGRRLLSTCLLAWGVVTIASVVIHLAPGDVVQTLLGRGDPSPELIQLRRHALGIDRPYLVQYIEWIGGLTRLNLGVSLASERPISPDIARALPRTLELICAGLLFGILIGIPTGILAASQRARLADLLVTVGALTGLSVPSFVSSTLMILFFGLFLKWFPTAGYVSLGEDPLAHVRYLLLPALTLGISLAALITRFTRSTMLEVMDQEYIRTAHAKGLGQRSIRYHHALKNALIPVITIIGMASGSLLGGTIIIEYVFSWPGISTLLIQGIDQRDYPMVQAVFLIIGILFLVINLVTDLVNGYVDPRIRYE